MHDWQNLNCDTLMVEEPVKVVVVGVGVALAMAKFVAAVEGAGGAGLAAFETFADTGGGVADFRRAAGDERSARQ